VKRRGSWISPARAVGVGLVAGAFGSLVQNLFFGATRKIAPSPPESAFTPPEPVQRGEPETQTVARRVVEDLARRDLPLNDQVAAGQVVHVAFGAAWGGLYGLLRSRRRTPFGPLGVAAFSLGVWHASDNVLLPVFRLAGPPSAYPLRSHAYAIAAHFAYGAAVWTAFELLRPASPRALFSLGSALWGTRKLPAVLRKPARRAVLAVHRADLGGRAAQVVNAVAGG
jgi:hypothetical protein